MNMNKQKPLRTFQAGSVRASVWDNQVLLKDGSTASMPQVCVERRYKNGEGEWTSSNYFNVNELGKLQAVVRAAFDWLVMKDLNGGDGSTANAMAARPVQRDDELNAKVVG